MKKNSIKKLLAFSSSTILPLTTIISCASRGGAEGDFDLTKGEYAKILESTKEIKIETQENYAKIEKQAYFFLYNQEQKGSIQAQKDAFAWERYELKRDIEEETDLTVTKGNNIDTNEDIEDEDEQYSEVINDKIKRWNKLNEIDTESLMEDLENNDSDLYESDTFASDYPEVLIDVEIIREKQSKIYEDRKTSHVETFERKSLGEDDWAKQLPESFGGASSDEEAIEYLVFQAIQSNALTRYSYSINDSFTKEQYDWAKDGGFVNFKFLEKAFIKTKDPKKEDKVYFLGNNSKISDLKSKAPELTNANKQTFFRHFLIKAVPDENGPDLPWTIATEDIEKLFRFESFDSSATSSQKHPYEYIPEVFKTWKEKDDGSAGDIFEGVNSKDSKFLEYYSNNSEGTKKIGGSLGTSTPLEFVAKMVPGFQLGVMKYMEDSKKSGFNNSGDILNKLVAALKEAYDDILKEARPKGTAKTPSNQKELDQYLKDVDNEKKEEIVGEAIRKVFDNNSVKGIDQFYYPVSDKRFVVISSNGIHIVTYSDTFDISTKNSGLQKMADEQTIDNDELKYSESVQNYYSQWRQFLEIADDKNFYDANANTGFLKDNEDKLSLEEGQELNKIFEDASSFAKQRIENTVFSSIKNISSNYQWLLNHFDQKLREKSTTSFDPEELYKKAKEFGGV